MLRFAFLVVLSLTAIASGEDCFAPFLTDTPPKIVEILETKTEQGVEVTDLRFLSRVVPETGREVLIFATLARPVGGADDAKRAGIVACHGGGGYCVRMRSRVIGWAKRGYVAIAQDQPGFVNRGKAKSTGPCMEKGASGFKIIDKPQDSSLFDGVAAVLNSLALLRSQPDVDKERVGVWGGSWGGYMTTMVAGVAGDRVKAAYSVYGCGFYDSGTMWRARLEKMPEAQRRIWLENLDAGRRASGLTATYFVPSPANDWFFWPSGVMRTLEQMPGDKNYCFHPNDSHGFGLPGGTGDRRANQSENRTYMEIPFFDLVLRGRGKPFGKVREVAEPVREGNGVRVFFETDAPVPTKRAFVCHAAGELTWRMKWWRSTVAQSEDGRRFSAVISVDESGEPVSWFGVVVDERDVSTSTLVRSFEPKALGLDPENVPVVRFLEDFETPSEHRRWRMRYAERRPGRHRIKAKAFRSGKYGLEIVPGESTMACWGVRGATLAHSDAPKLVFWMRAVGEACPPPIVDLQAESPSGVRFVWQWKNPSDQLVSKEWCRVEAPLSQFSPKSKGVAPDMLSAQLGQLRFTTTTTTHVYIDDVSFE